MGKFDELTGLLAGQNLERRLDGLLDRADDTGEPISLAIADLGGLRAINEAFGREGGDAVLRAVARTIVETRGDAAYCYRLGGDAFIVLYPGLGADGGDEQAARLKEAIGKATAAVKDGSLISLQAYTGRATYPGDGQRARTLIRAADRRMQEARAAATAGPPVQPADSPR